MSEEHQTNPDTYKNDDFSDDPLAELARIVSGNSDMEEDDDSGVVQQANSPARQPSDRSVSFSRTNFQASEEDFELSLEAELAQELEGEEPSVDHSSTVQEDTGLEQPVSPETEGDFHVDLLQALKDEVSPNPAEQETANAIDPQSNDQAQVANPDDHVMDGEIVPENVTSEVSSDFQSNDAVTSEFPDQSAVEMAEVPAETASSVQEHQTEAAAEPGIASDPEVDLGAAFAAEFEQMAAKEAERLEAGQIEESVQDNFEQEFGAAFADELAGSENGKDPAFGVPHDQSIAGQDSQDYPQESGEVLPPPTLSADNQPLSSGGGNRKYAVAALVIALIAGVTAAGYGFWGSEPGSGGEAAIIKADADPVKIKPEDPGGRVVANQDKASYEKVEGSLSSQQQQDSLISSTEEPAELGSGGVEESLALTLQDSNLPGIGAKSDDRLEQGATDGASDELTEIAPRKVRTVTVKPDGTILRPANAATSETAGDLLTNQVTTTENVVAETVQAAIDGARTTGQVTVPEASPLPKPEPVQQTATEQVAATQPTTPAPATPTETQVAPTTSAASEWVVQVSSQRSEEAAKASYQNLANRFQVLQGRPMAIQRANIEDKGTFFRVRIQTASRSDADSLCNSLKSSGGSCFVTR